MGGYNDTKAKPAPTKPLLTKWRFLQLTGEKQHVGGMSFQVLDLEDGALYRWQNGRCLCMWIILCRFQREDDLFYLTLSIFVQIATR